LFILNEISSRRITFFNLLKNVPLRMKFISFDVLEKN
jgi:hypothetical protein